MGDSLSLDEVRKIHAYWRAANYLSVGQIYLYANPLLKRAPETRACETKTPWSLGYNARAEFHIRPPQQNNQEKRS